MVIRFSKHTLRWVALLTLLLPSVAFLLTWVRPLISIPGTVLLAFAFGSYVRTRKAAEMDAFGDDENVFECRVSVLVMVIACAVIWTFFSGIGGLFYQNEDHYGRNAIFHDLLEHDWPVYFEGTPYALTYYIAYWILPSLFGKMAMLWGHGEWCWPAANAMLFAQTVWFLVIAFLLFLSLVRPRTWLQNALCLLLFVLFSGMDGLMIPFFPNWWNNQIEWWAQAYQFSSNTTCLFWVYNQAVPAWLAFLLLLSCPWDIGSYALIGLSAFPFSPMPFMGLMVYLIGLAMMLVARHAHEMGICQGIQKTVRDCFTMRNIFACIAIAPSFLTYFLANDASSGAPLRIDLYFSSYGVIPAWIHLILFLFIEFGAYALIIGKKSMKNPLFLLTLISLILAPMVRIGYGQDFSMRASIPGLMGMTVFCAKYLLESIPGKRRVGAWVLTLLLLVGSITPFLEFARGLYKVKHAGTIFLEADPFKTVLHPQADTHNFICRDITASSFYTYFAKKGLHVE